MAGQSGRGAIGQDCQNNRLHGCLHPGPVQLPLHGRDHRHLHPPPGRTRTPHPTQVYERSVPKEVLYPNYPIIEGFEAINKMKDLQASLEYDK